jgi:hypothetical protein
LTAPLPVLTVPSDHRAACWLPGRLEPLDLEVAAQHR